MRGDVVRAHSTCCAGQTCGVAPLIAIAVLLVGVGPTGDMYPAIESYSQLTFFNFL